MTEVEKRSATGHSIAWQQPIPRASLHEEIVARLRAMIQDGSLPPGTRVPESELCKRFSISRTPLREALKVLASEGLVVLMPNRGSMVSWVEVDELRAVFEVMESLESLTGHLVCERIGSQGVAVLEEQHAIMERHFSAGDRTAYFQANQKIHQTLVAASENPVLANTYEQLATKINRARALANADEHRWAESLDEHRMIMVALLARDGAALAAHLVTHTRNTARAVIAGLEAAQEAE